jgi:hypothetical protein
MCAVILLAAVACNEHAVAPATMSPSQSAQALAGDCAGTVLSYGEPPGWSQSGWTHTSGTPWPVPWTIAASGDAVAFVFAGKLVAGPSPRVDGSNNKVLWVLHDPVQFVVEARPSGKTTPVVTVPGGPSIVDVPTPGCWTFRLIQVNDASKVSTISLDVLPHGSSPL